MRPYRFKMRLSSKRLNVTRLGKGPAAAWRTAARASLGSASSDIELMLHLLSCDRHDRADRPPPQEGLGERARIVTRRTSETLIQPGTCRHGIVSRNHNTALLPPSDRPAGLRKDDPALARSFRLRIPQPPAPRGRR